MEHLVLPSGGLPAEYQLVPWLGGTYDRGDFLTWPERNNRPGFLCTEQSHIPHRSGHRQPRKVNEIFDGVYAYSMEKIVQDWIFFGLLHTFLGDDFHEADFTRYSDEGDGTIYVHTEKLSTLLAACRPTENGTHKILSIYDGCRLVDSINWGASLLKKLGHSPSFDPLLWISTFTVLELLETLLHEAKEDTNESRRIECWNTSDTYGIVDNPCASRCLRDIMSQNSWCPSNAVASLNRSTSLTAALYFSCLQKLDKASEHLCCSDQHCVRSNVSYEQLLSHGSVHRDNCHGCKEIGVNDDQLDYMESLILMGDTPILALSIIADVVSISVRPRHEGDKYIAVSHVWADGLGNPNSNNIQQCQLSNLIVLVSEINTPQEENLLWIDTLCCPVQNRQARARIISKLSTIYKQAEYVLVLDAMLQETRVTDHHFCHKRELELTAQTLTSNWARRVWTFQEAVCARELLVAFKDSIVCLNSLRQHLRSLEITHVAMSLACHPVLLALDTMLDPPQTTQNQVLFLRCIQGLQDRISTQRHDEPLCLSSLLGLDSELIANISGVGRFEKFWRMAFDRYQISSEVVFFSGPKLSVPGLKWAPESLTYRKAVNSVIDCEFSPQRAASLIPGGLRSCLPGLLLCAAPSLSKGLNTRLPTFLVRDMSGLFFKIKMEKNACKNPGAVAGPSGHLALIFQPRSDLYWHGPRSCVLAEVVSATEEIVRVRRVCHAQATLLRPDKQEELTTSFVEAQKLVNVGQRPPLKRQRSDEMITTHLSDELLEATKISQLVCFHDELVHYTPLMHSCTPLMEENKTWDIEY